MISGRARARVVLACCLLSAASALAAPPPPILAPLTDGREVELPPLDPAVPSPSEVLGYPLGERFTHWSEIVDYLELLAAASDRVAIRDYGTTYEGRPLKLLIISSPENIARLEEVRQGHLDLVSPRRTPAAELERRVAEAPVVAWLGYGVHGNESSSAEAAMAAAYVLAAAGGEWDDRLDHLVVVIDPLVNPDGRERYVHFYASRRGARPDPSPLAAEHHEPWPGGRQNHYLIDLNRDWAFLTQRESRARVAAFHEWLPQVFVDYHEMGADSTYFFPPSAQPIHPQIRPETVRWLEVFGRANGAAFDRQGWLYYVGQRFDLFYPGYGDSYPALNGAVGMTYEMAGHGFAGTALEREDGSLLTLADRVARHLTTSLATAATAAAHRAELLRQFVAGRREGMAAPARHYLWDAAQTEAAAAARLLESHGIELSQLAADTRLDVRRAAGGAATSRTFAAGTWIASTDQPRGGVLRALMDHDVAMPADFVTEQRLRIEQNRRAEFYDVTAWSLPLAYGLEAWTTDDPPPGRRPVAPLPLATIVPTEAGTVGYLSPPHGFATYRLAARLAGEGIRYRLATAGFRSVGSDYAAGTLFVPFAGNPEATHQVVAEAAREIGAPLAAATSVFSDEGVSLGADEVIPIRPPSIGLVGGEGVRTTDFGALWHLLDEQIGLPVHRLEITELGRLDLSRLDALILPDGGYSRALGDAAAEAVERWVRGGGVLIAVGGAHEWLRARELTEVQAWEPPPPDEAKVPLEVAAVALQDRSLYTPGAALATRLGGPHPLLAGVASPPAVLYRGSRVLLPTGNPQSDLLLADDERPVVAGFAWPEAAQRLRGALLLSVEPAGDGAVVLFAQDPAFRAFWRATAPLLLNAAIYGPSLSANW